MCESNDIPYTINLFKEVTDPAAFILSYFCPSLLYPGIQQTGRREAGHGLSYDRDQVYTTG